MPTYNDYKDDAIKGSELKTVLTSVATEIKKKQDIVDAEYDSANHRLVLNNIDIEVAS